MLDLASLGTILTAVTGSQVFIEWIRAHYSKNKTNADASAVLVDAMLRWQTTLTGRIAELEKTIFEQTTKIALLEARTCSHCSSPSSPDIGNSLPSPGLSSP